jgi:hypothetical protein
MDDMLFEKKYIHPVRISASYVLPHPVLPRGEGDGINPNGMS